ncbi:enoyl-CoA hydratase/isomerase family protein [Novosphingobium album (ex Hu et al. 2023)]|uniref:Enoyl-CoA hydratase/isomerase family protein n=1 Tax=Novosphingobium album (ex Hu et al. 2023) TaxID=2930093 RepID=A0ABT0AYC4_9SPHN|nr:enoyl-CoA hydratase/isomerase family protein [Novosphingobium album (ex Hu et al. 2023)]MCJ2177792.1 enoyl-CoA hydratase/isomerase family protein [Novosphingobium album (ex Hu et al. 2023)]
MGTTATKRPPAEEIVLYEKDPATKIATITLNRPEALNAPTIAARQRFADLVMRANVDDDVKVLIVRGVGNHLGSGADLPEMDGMWSEDPDYSCLPEFRIGENEGVNYPPKGSFRYLANITNLYANSNAGLRSLQDFKKISIVECKGYCYGWHFYQCADADIIVSSDDALFGHSAFRYVGWAARMWQWALMMGLRPFMEMVFTGRPFTAQEMKELHFVNSVVPREKLEAETMKYALACARNRPVDTVVMQKMFFEVFKQQQGEYMGSIMSGWLESMLPMMQPDADTGIGVDAETFEKGLANAVKDNDRQFPPDWRLSMKGRKQP